MFDIQDVGARFYTYIWTMYDCMVAASLAGVRFVVLDRPNPITATAAHGPVLHPEHSTFVGAQGRSSQQHGMTVGELAGLFNAEFLPEDADGRRPGRPGRVEMEGWRREHVRRGHRAAVGDARPPTCRRVETAVVYPGTCLFEATNLSEGRGTTRPFELIGAPVRRPPVGRRPSTTLDLPGVDFREAYFTPSFSKHAGVACGGVQLHVTDRDDVRRDPHRDRDDRHGPRALRRVRLARDRRPPYWIDKLTGIRAGPRWRSTPGPTSDEVVAVWQRRARRVPRRPAPSTCSTAGRS